MGRLRKRRTAGITFRRETVTGAENRTPSSWINGSLEFILITGFMLFMAWCLVTGLNLAVLPFSFNIGIVLSVALFYGLFHIPKYRTILAPLSATFFVVWVFFEKRQIIDGFHFAANHFIQLFNFYYESNLVYFLVERTGETKYATTFLLFVVVWIIGLFSMFRWVRHRPMLSFLCTLPMLILPLIVGELPDSVYLSGYLIIAAALLGGGALSANRLDYRVHMKVTILILVVGFGLLYAASLIFTPKAYEKTGEINQIKTTMQTAMIEFSTNDFFDETWLEDLLPFGDGVASGGLSRGKLGRVEKVVFSNETALVVTVPKQVEDKLYLRGYIGSSYNGDFWGQLSKGDKEQYDTLWQEFANWNLSPETMGLWSFRENEQVNTTLTMEIQNVNAGRNNSFLPYEARNRMYIGDDGLLQVPDKKNKTTYSVDYYAYFNQDITKLIGLETDATTGLGLVTEKLQREYNTFAYQAYTKLPSKDSQASKVFQAFQLQEGENTILNVVPCVFLVQEYLDSQTSYSLSPGMLPQGKDFVDYFLFENKKGYCTHYASAATVLLRSMGIPARYVEGYVVTSLDLKKGTVSKVDNTITMKLKDSNAHAWVEVYVKELGWLPVEVTPGYTNGNEIPQEIKDQIQKKGNLNAAPIPSIHPTNTAPTPPVLVGQQTGKGLTLVDKNEPMSYILRILQVVAGAGIVFLVAAVLTLLRRRYWSYQRNKLLKEGDNKKIITFYYRELEKVLAQYGLIYKGEDYEEYAKRVERKLGFLKRGQFASGFSVVLEASFSDLTMGKAKTEQVLSLYDAVAQGISQTASRRQRLCTKIFSNMK